MASPEEISTDETSPSYPPPTRTAPQEGRSLTIGGFVCAAIGIFFFGILLGPAAIVLGYMGHRRGDYVAKWAIVAGAIVFVLSIVGIAILAGSGSS